MRAQCSTIQLLSRGYLQFLTDFYGTEAEKLAHHENSHRFQLQTIDRCRINFRLQISMCTLASGRGDMNS